MYIFKKRNVAYEVVGEEIYSYDIIDDAIDESSEGKLTGITSDDKKEIERLLQIDSIEDYGIEILDDKPVEIEV